MYVSHFAQSKCNNADFSPTLQALDMLSLLRVHDGYDLVLDAVARTAPAPRQRLMSLAPTSQLLDPTRDALLRASQPTSRIHSRRGDAGAARSKASAGELEQERLRPSKQGRRAGLPALLKRLPAFLWGLPADVGIRGRRRFFSAWTATFPTRKFEPRTRTPRPVTHPRAPSSRHRPRLRHRPSPSSSSVSSGGSSGSSVSFFSSV